MLIAVAARCGALLSSSARILHVSSNPSRGLVIVLFCGCFCVCIVFALLWADLVKNSYLMCVRHIISEVNSELERDKGLKKLES
jgi:hypothetical protein